VHELQLLAGHASITTTQRYMNARVNSLAESMRKARERRSNRVDDRDDDQNVQVGVKTQRRIPVSEREAVPFVTHLSPDARSL